ncbi:MAG: hypothetical protein NTY99_00155 [DPANN group archaeon]|nr:hypothetical protein [DPANN group archaeon]
MANAQDKLVKKLGKAFIDLPALIDTLKDPNLYWQNQSYCFFETKIPGKYWIGIERQIPHVGSVGRGGYFLIIRDVRESHHEICIESTSYEARDKVIDKIVDLYDYVDKNASPYPQEPKLTDLKLLVLINAFEKNSNVKDSWTNLEDMCYCVNSVPEVIFPRDIRQEIKLLKSQSLIETQKGKHNPVKYAKLTPLGKYRAEQFRAPDYVAKVLEVWQKEQEK